MENPISFALAVLFILGTPGPTNTLLAASGATRGIGGSVHLLAAEAAGYLISILTLGLLLGPVVASSPAVGVVLRLGVGAYLVFLAVKLWRQGGKLAAGPTLIRWRDVFVTTLLNPKAIIFAAGVVPFASPLVASYMTAFLMLLGIVGFGWILVGRGIGGMASGAGRSDLAPKAGAAAISVFALLILASPFLPT
jgi:threonine/homoserine/homoserine lactone efflux protein